MSTGRNLFTPRNKATNERMTLMIADYEISLIGRRGPWQAVVTDLDSSITYRCEGAPCTLPGCFCDAIAEELPKEETPSARRMDIAIQVADDAFWSAISHQYPEANCGDMDPATSGMWAGAMENAVTAWLEVNAPEALTQGLPDCPTTCQACCEKDAEVQGEFCLECWANVKQMMAQDKPDPNYYWIAGCPEEDDSIWKFETKEACDARTALWEAEGYPYVGPTRFERTPMLSQIIAELTNVADCLVDDEKNEQTICLDMASDLRSIINRMEAAK